MQFFIVMLVFVTFKKSTTFCMRCVTYLQQQVCPSAAPRPLRHRRPSKEIHSVRDPQLKQNWFRTEVCMLVG